MSDVFDFRPSTRVVFGVGAANRLGELTNDLGVRRALLVTDPGIVAAGHVALAEDALGSAGVEFLRYSDVHENPTGLDVMRCVSVAREFAPDVFIGFGGGSSIDVAKGTNLVLSGGGRIQDYWGVGKANAELGDSTRSTVAPPIN